MRSNSCSASPSSSPPTPPSSPLPISTGPGNQTYTFTPSPSLCPPFSTSHTSDEDHPRLLWAFSLDRPLPDPQVSDSSRTSCLKDLLDWVTEICCKCFSWFLNPPSSKIFIHDMAIDSSSIQAKRLA